MSAATKRNRRLGQQAPGVRGSARAVIQHTLAGMRGARTGGAAVVTLAVGVVTAVTVAAEAWPALKLKKSTAPSATNDLRQRIVTSK